MRENSSLADIRKKRQKGIVMASLSIADTEITDQNFSLIRLIMAFLLMIYELYIFVTNTSGQF